MWEFIAIHQKSNKFSQSKKKRSFFSGTTLTKI